MGEETAAGGEAAGGFLTCGGGAEYQGRDMRMLSFAAAAVLLPFLLLLCLPGLRRRQSRDLCRNRRRPRVRAPLGRRGRGAEQMRRQRWGGRRM